MGELAKRLVEVEEVLSYLPYEDLLKIPEEIWNTIQSKKDKTYTWQYDENLSLKDQNLPKDTIVMLSYLNIKYLLNQEEIDFVQNLLEFNETKKTSNLSNENKTNVVNEAVSENYSDNVQKAETKEEIVEYKTNIFSKLINKIKSLFSKSN